MFLKPYLAPLALFQAYTLDKCTISTRQCQTWDRYSGWDAVLNVVTAGGRALAPYLGTDSEQAVSVWPELVSTDQD